MKKLKDNVVRICSFCQARQDQVDVMIRARNDIAAICDGCIDDSFQLIEERRRKHRKNTEEDE